MYINLNFKKIKKRTRRRRHPLARVLEGPGEDDRAGVPIDELFAIRAVGVHRLKGENKLKKVKNCELS
jgi:hypothetical protein